MAASPPKPKLVVIVGPTASGKSELALWTAKAHNGEIIAADSRTIFKGLDIGTAKPTLKEMAQIPHWGLDLVEPGRRFTAADFKKYAQAKITEITNRGNLPILVGGTGLYIDSVLFDFKFRPEECGGKRADLEELTIQELQSIVTEKGYQMPENSLNKRHLVRVIESAGALPERASRPHEGALIAGLWPPDELLKQSIAKRSKKMFYGGVLEETQRLLARYGRQWLEGSGIVYQIAAEVLEDGLDIEEAILKSQTLDWQYARRQRTWFKRDPFIAWHKDTVSAQKYIKEALNT